MKIEAEPPRPAPEWPLPQSGEPARPFIDFLAEPEPRGPMPEVPEAPAPQSGEPVRPFTDFLAEPEPPGPGPEAPEASQSGEPARPSTDFLAESESRAARFTELGMFGMSGAVAAPPGRASGGNPAPDPQAVPASLARGTALTLSETPPPPTDFLDSRLDSGKSVTCELPGPVPVKTVAGKPCTLPGDALDPFVPEAEERVDAEAPVRPNRPRPRPQPQRPGVSLTLRETDGLVEIIAGAPPIDSETRAQLRRLIEAILARNGLSLAQFQLNGAPLAPDLSGRRGGTYGTRTR